MGKIIVVGGGPAGMMAAITGARNGHQVSLLEHNEKLGKKLFITGKGRCNVTNDCDTENLLGNVISNPKFLYSALYGFDSAKTMEFFKQLGVRLKVERGNRVFPQSDHSSDIIKALEYEMRRLGVRVCLNTHVKSLLIEENNQDHNIENNQEKNQENNIECKKENTADDLPVDKWARRKKDKAATWRTCLGVVLDDGEKISADAVILATGGISYPLTGADRSGMDMAQACGMKVTPLYPALVPLLTGENWSHELMGLALKNVSVSVKQGKKMLYEGFGEMLFTHVGVSGPLILSASSILTKKLKEGPLNLCIDLKPALSDEQLDKRLLRDFEALQNKAIKNAMAGVLPSRLIKPVLDAAGIEEEKKVNVISKKERQSLVYTLKHLMLTITGTADFNEAIVTQGGICVKDVNASTMEAKNVRHLYLAGECLDVDALTGGFNLQIAWATGYLAGLHAAEGSKTDEL